MSLYDILFTLLVIGSLIFCIIYWKVLQDAKIETQKILEEQKKEAAAKKKEKWKDYFSGNICNFKE